MKLLLIAVVVMLGGCAMGMGGMNADQINAAVKDKSSAAGCTSYTGAGGQFQAMFVNNDKTFGTAGGKTTIKCGAAEVVFEDAGKASAVAKPLSSVAPEKGPQ